MRKLGGFRLGRRLAVKVWRWNKRCLRVKLSRSADRPSDTLAARLLNWGRRMSLKLKGGGDYYRVGEKIHDDGGDGKLPKGHLAVYVGGDGKEWGPPQRYLVPVIHFNHPLFGELLREAEAEFGFEHPGGITIPCPVSRFERVQTRIASEPGRKSGGSWPFVVGSNC